MVREGRERVGFEELVQYLSYTQRIVYRYIREENLPVAGIKERFRFKKLTVDIFITIFLIMKGKKESVLNEVDIIPCLRIQKLVRGIKC